MRRDRTEALPWQDASVRTAQAGERLRAGQPRSSPRGGTSSRCSPARAHRTSPGSGRSTTTVPAPGRSKPGGPVSNMSPGSASTGTTCGRPTRSAVSSAAPSSRYGRSLKSRSCCPKPRSGPRPTRSPRSRICSPGCISTGRWAWSGSTRSRTTAFCTRTGGWRATLRPRPPSGLACRARWPAPDGPAQVSLAAAAAARPGSAAAP